MLVLAKKNRKFYRSDWKFDCLISHEKFLHEFKHDKLRCGTQGKTDFSVPVLFFSFEADRTR